MSEADMRELEKVFHLNLFKENYVIIPSDLLFQKTIPLRHIRISFIDGQQMATADVHVFDDFLTLPQNPEPYAIYAVGTMIVNNDFINPIGITVNENCIISNRYGAIPETKSKYLRGMDILTNKLNQNGIEHISACMLLCWYLIQLAMLNPMTQPIFSATPKLTVGYQSSNSNNKGKKRKVKYIKKYNLSAAAIKTIIEQSPRKYMCPVWYVCGHWRTYKNGRRIFIQPYWKGTMREQRMKIGDVSRDREIAQLSAAKAVI